jgi:hypothetical protein
MTPPINSVSPERLEEMLAAIPRYADGTVRSSGWVGRVPAPELEAILAELAARRAANTPVDGVENLRRRCAASGFHDHDGCTCSDDELRSRYASPALPSQVVGVKELVWEKSNVAERWTATHAFGLFEITHYNEGYVWQRGICSERFPSLETAQSAVQADFNARIRSCLTSPAAEVVAWLPDNLLSHRKSWLKALERLIELEPESSEPDMDEKGYWRHERQAMLDMYADLDTHPAPSASREVTEEQIDTALNVFTGTFIEALGSGKLHDVAVRSSWRAALTAALTLPEREM